MKKKLATLVAMLALAVPSLVWSAAPAHAAGWLGYCWGRYGNTWVSGWCDGNGPDYTYRAELYCSNGRWYIGPTRWAGDRRGSAAECPSGKTRKTSRLNVFYKGSHYKYQY